MLKKACLAFTTLASPLFSIAMEHPVITEELPAVMEYFDREYCPSKGFVEWCKGSDEHDAFPEYPDKENCPSDEFVKYCESFEQIEKNHAE